MNANLEPLIEAIAQLRGECHGAGTIGRNVLPAIRHTPAVGLDQHSIETASGKTVLLLSHLSDGLTVFAVDAKRSISQVLFPSFRPTAC